MDVRVAGGEAHGEGTLSAGWRVARAKESGTFSCISGVASHSQGEERLRAIGKTESGRPVFLVFTIRVRAGKRVIRPVCARYMHRKEVRHYEEENPGV
ncbi:MAG: hypothetical protein EXR27_12695 [Betaproteobacteria bacterium]|nr:hypothetical protein [Betaproteobacteria bacterium]